MLIEYLLAGAALGALAQDTDTTFAVESATRLDVESGGGEVIVVAWDRDEIRIQAEHSRRSEVEIRRSGRTIYVEAEGQIFNGIVDYRISVPAGMDVSVEGFQTSISVEGMAGEVDAETFQGNVTIRGGDGSVSASSVNGQVLVDGARGRVSAEVVSGSIRILNSSGKISAESVSGSIVLEHITATSVEVETVSGRIEFSGSVAPGDDYFFGTHSGRVILELPSNVEADLRLSTLSGNVSLTHPRAEGTRVRPGRRSRVLMGDGGAVIEVETFSGRIVVREAGR